MKKNKKKYEFKTLESYLPEQNYCHSPSAYHLGDIYVKPKKQKNLNNGIESKS